MRNSRFTVATHILAFLAMPGDLIPDALQTSEAIARSVNTNPRVVRRIIGTLRDAGLVEVFGGASGGARLARDPRQLTLLDVYKVIEQEELFGLHPNPPLETCPVGSTIQSVLTNVYAGVDAAVERELGSITIADLYAQMRATFLAG